MKKIFLFLAALPVFACTEKGTDPVKPEVAVTAGEVTESTLSFTVTSSDALAAAWLCQPQDAKAPTPEAVLADGKAVAANQAVACTATGLNDNTTYVIYAAAMNDDTFVLSTPVPMTTAEIPVQPAAVLAAVGTGTYSFSFTVTPSDANKVVYKVYASTEEASVEDVLATGTEVSATEQTTVELDGMTVGSWYVVAVAGNGKTNCMSQKLKFQIRGAETVGFNVTSCQAKSYGKDVLLDFYDESLNCLKIDFYHGASGETSLPAGTYKWGYYPESSDTPGNFELWSAYTYWNFNGTKYEFTGGTVTVSKQNSTFTIAVNLTRNDEKVLNFTWVGVPQWK